MKGFVYCILPFIFHCIQNVCSQSVNETDNNEPEGISLASLHYDYVREPLIICIFITTLGICKILFHHSKLISSLLPESCLLIFLGLIVGFLFVAFGITDKSISTLSPRSFFLFLLPPIILEAAYSLHDRSFVGNLGTILLFAVVGTLMNFFIIGPAIYGLSYCGLIKDHDFSFIDCMVFASLIVAVDPVAVLAIFQEIGVNNVLYFIVFGESLLNDAVTVVLYNTMIEFAGMNEIHWTQSLLAIAAFFSVSLGGLFIGIVCGAVSSFITRWTDRVRVAEPLTVLIIAYSSYLLAELFHFSGIISIIGCGLMQAHYAFQNIGQRSIISIKYAIKMLSGTSDAVIFLYLGISTATDKHDWSIRLILWSIVLCLFTRMFVTAFLAWFVNLFRLRKLDFQEIVIMSYGGLRGAVAFSLVKSLDEDVVPSKTALKSATICVVFFTVFVQGCTVKPLVSALRVAKEGRKVASITHEITTQVTKFLMNGIEEIIGGQNQNALKDILAMLDKRFLQKLLQKYPERREDKLMRLYSKIALELHYETLGLDHGRLSAGSSMAEIHKTQSTEDLLTDELLRRKPGKNGIRRSIMRKSGRMTSMAARVLSNHTETGDDITVHNVRKWLNRNPNSLHQTYDPDIVHNDMDLLSQLNRRTIIPDDYSEVDLNQSYLSEDDIPEEIITHRRRRTTDNSDHSVLDTKL